VVCVGRAGVVIGGSLEDSGVLVLKAVRARLGPRWPSMAGVELCSGAPGGRSRRVLSTTNTPGLRTTLVPPGNSRVIWQATTDPLP
jgi:hypothetical protein